MGAVRDNQRSKWWTSMIQKYGSEDAVREFMKKNQKKSRRHPNTKKGGFFYLRRYEPDKLRKITAYGGSISKRKKKTEDVSTEVQVLSDEKTQWLR